MKKMFLVLIAFVSITGFAAGKLDDLRADNKNKGTSEQLKNAYFYDSKDRIYNMAFANGFRYDSSGTVISQPLTEGKFFSVTGTPVKNNDDIIIKSKDLIYRIVNADAAKIKVNVYGTFNVVITESVKKNEFKVEILLPLPKDELAQYIKNGHFPAIRTKTNE